MNRKNIQWWNPVKFPPSPWEPPKTDHRISVSDQFHAIDGKGSKRAKRRNRRHKTGTDVIEGARHE